MRLKLKEVKELEDDGLIQKERFDKLPIKVEYILTELGEYLLPILAVFQDRNKGVKCRSLNSF
ncbi:winged helix-turn-helix transcriptional regulator [Viridibacillus arvi]|uniref:winged helix-turn-helix transcriptional regulator n=1 Tax=Viridibacillus arvi TaxID=263475 RepID=UPI003D036CCA